MCVNIGRILFSSSYQVCQVDGSGDCGDDMLKELYPDDDIPEDLIGFLDDKVFSSEKKLGSILQYKKGGDFDFFQRVFK